ncbi:MAG: M20/M25/M40 family metallo-hydrolase [Anaerolineae bacterium]|nr:M20/M25/M40 family metallo-hydrolase [Anaerolineae bacterium]
MQDILRQLAARPDVAAFVAGAAGAPILETAIAIQQIPAPTFHEDARADWIRSRMLEAGLSEVVHIVHEGDVYNVYGRIPGFAPDAPALLVSAHTDTVFDADTDLSIRHEPAQGRVYGPGLGDNSLGVAALLTLAGQIQAAGYRPPCDLWFVANAREEGLGDLGGIKAAVAHLRDRIGAVIILEGMTLGWVYNGGIAVRRHKITCRGPGGHSWGSFGAPSAIHYLMKLGARIAEIETTVEPRSTFNIGIVEGGETINTIAPHAALWLDLRSETTEGVEALERQVFDLVETVCTGGIETAVELVGSRPAGSIPRGHWLVQAAILSGVQVGVVLDYSTGSTDANAVLAAGLPGICVGVTQGGNAHRPDEYIETGPIDAGMRYLALLVVLAAHQLVQTAPRRAEA